MTEINVKLQTQEFYDQIGWQQIGECIYQNARYEDLRPVSREYIHKCHQRVGRYLDPVGRYLLDAGSGPIQYPEYVEYSQGYEARICVDISIVALQEARSRIGDHQTGGHGMFVVADIANLPFVDQAFDGVVSLHTIHHLPHKEHFQAYHELYRLLAADRCGVVVNGWKSAPISHLLEIPLTFKKNLWLLSRRLRGNPVKKKEKVKAHETYPPKGAFVNRHTADWAKKVLAPGIPIEIYVWRSINVRFLRSFIHDRWGGRLILRLLYWLEERFPHFFGENGQYPIIVIRKPQTEAGAGS